MVRIGQVVERSQVDGEDAHCGTANGQSGRDPVDGGERGPAKPEETDGEENRLDADEVETAFGGGGEFPEAGGDLFLPDAYDSDENNAAAHCCLNGLMIGWERGIVVLGVPVNTAPVCWTLKPWFVLKTSGTELNCR